MEGSTSRPQTPYLEVHRDVDASGYYASRGESNGYGDIVPAVIPILGAMGLGVAVEALLSRGKASKGDYVASAVIAPLPIGVGFKHIPKVLKKGKHIHSAIKAEVRYFGKAPANREVLEASVMYYSPEIAAAAGGLFAHALISGSFDKMRQSSLVEYGHVITSPGGGGRSLPNQSRRSRRGKKAAKNRCSHVNRYGQRCVLTKGHLGRHSYDSKK